MAVCPACEVEIDVDEFDVEPGDEMSCPECGANVEVAKVLPVELTLAGEEEDYDDQARDEGDIDGGAEDDGEDDTDWEA